MKITPLLLLVVFLILKLTGTIAWSWLWVLSPLWIPAALATVVGVGFSVVIGTAYLVAEVTGK